VSKYVISINYGEEEFESGEDRTSADRAYEKACANYPDKTVTLADEEMIREQVRGE
jgi:hypothetical protein